MDENTRKLEDILIDHAKQSAAAALAESIEQWLKTQRKWTQLDRMLTLEPAVNPMMDTDRADYEAWLDSLPHNSHDAARLRELERRAECYDMGGDDNE